MQEPVLRARLEELLSRAPSQKVVVFGDVMLDHYVFGSMEAAPEPPGVKFRVESEEFRLGGAGNVARNLAALGTNVSLVSLVGGTHHQELADLLEQSHIEPALIFDEKRRTTTKRRYVSSGAVEMRADWETREEAGEAASVALVRAVEKWGLSSNAIIVSDYQKGVLSSEAMRAVADYAAKESIPLFVDPKFRSAEFYKGAQHLKLNEKEAAFLLGRVLSSEEEYRRAGADLLGRISGAAVLLTRGRKGMTLFESEHEPITIETAAREVFDVVGAGDTVLATFSLMRICGATLAEAARIANAAAGIVVGKSGTAAVTEEELLRCTPIS